MDVNPYEPPKHHENPHLGWRAFWKRVCCESLCLAVGFFVTTKIFATVAHDADETAWIIMVDGLLALGELVPQLSIVSPPRPKLHHLFGSLPSFPSTSRGG